VTPVGERKRKVEAPKVAKPKIEETKAETTKDEAPAAAEAKVEETGLKQPAALGAMVGEPEAERPEVEEPKTPRRRRLRRRWIALIVVGAVIMLLVVASLVTAHFTSRSSFCDTCHEMEPYYASWQTSSHSATECIDCHIPPGFVAFVKTKFYAFRELWVHLTGDSNAPLTVTREVPNDSCLRCHDAPASTTLSDVTFSHETHQGQYCITCHVRMVHSNVNPPYYAAPGSMWSCLECHLETTLPSQCSTCHTPGHEPRGECSTCHDMQNWSAAAAGHPFPLTGGHTGLPCAACHVSRPGAEIIPGTNLPRPNPSCVSCHGNRHGGLTNCARCHTVNSWTPTTFRHPAVGPHLSGEHRLSCSTCHPSGYASSTCGGCHDGGGEDGGEEEGEEGDD
jgi:cytochrome c nitrite reductase small subunit